MNSPNIEFLVSQIDKALLEINESFCDSSIKINGCRYVNSNTNDFSSKCVNKCLNNNNGSTASESHKYLAVLQLILDLFKILLYTSIKELSGDINKAAYSYV